MADDSQTFFLDLDITKFTENALAAQGTIQGLGDAQNLSGLMEGLLAASAALAAVGLVAYSLKATFDLVFQGEQIQKTNDLFDRLSESMGIAGDKLKTDLVAASGGLASETDILNAANKAMIMMGDNAGRLPEIMELARKATVAFGGDVMERFQQLTFAISSGSQRMLRQNGIMLDVNKAVKDFAESQGVAADMLTAAGRKQAIMNAALEQGADRFKDVDVNQKLAITTSQQFKVAIKEIGEAFAIAFEKIAGPTVRAVMADIAAAATFVKNEMVAAFGSGSAQSAASIDVLKEKIAGLQNLQRDPAAMQYMGQNAESVKAQLADLEKQLKTTQAMDDEIQRKKASQKVQSGGGATEDPAVKQELVDQKKLADSRAKFEDEILKLQLENSKKRVQMADSEESLQTARQQRDTALATQHEQEMANLDRQWAEKKITSHDQYLAMRKQTEDKYAMESKQLRESAAAEETTMEANKLKHAQNTFDGIQKAAQVSASAANRSLHDFGKQGTMVMDTLQKQGKSAFESFGKAAVDHSQSASEIMKGFFLNALADIAEAQGELYLAMGFVDPTKLAAGAALLALAGALRAMAGSAGASSGSGSGGGGGGYSSGSSAASSQTNQAAAAATPPEQKTLTVQIMGSYFESDQTKTHLMDMMRQVTDATDYKYQSIGSA